MGRNFVQNQVRADDAAGEFSPGSRGRRPGDSDLQLISLQQVIETL